MQSDKYITTTEFPEKEISKAWERDEQIGGIAFGQDKWILLTSTRTSYGLQRWATSSAFPSKEIKEGWDEGYDIIFLDYVHDRWVVFQAKESGFTDQIWRTSSQFPEKEIKQGLKDGYAVTDLSYGVDRWAVVMSKGTSFTEQTIRSSDGFPEDAISEGWNNGRDITGLAFGDKTWVLIMSKTTGFVTQSWSTRNNFEPKLIADKAAAGNEISRLLHADGMWNFVFTTFPESSRSGTGISDAAGKRPAATAAPESKPQAVVHFEDGRKYAEEGKHEKAVVQFRKAIEIDPDYSMAINSLGVSLDMLGEKREALECFRKAFGLDNTDPVIFGNLVCQVISNEESSSQILDAVAKTDENTIARVDSGIVLNNIGYAYAEAGKFDTAITYYLKALELDPENKVIADNLEEAKNSKAETHTGIPGTPAVSTNEEVADDSIEFLLKELNKLVGLDDIKREVDALMKYIRVDEERRERGFALGSTTLHTVFTGPPGTGKTTMARLMGRFFKALGILKKGHVVEVDRSDLVAKYIGETALKTNSVIDSALDGILFIDEAYSLVPQDAKGDFGEEVVNILVKRMEDHKHNLIVIVAGYEDEMKRFINSNPGLKHRFTRYFYFRDYTPEQLTRIFESICRDTRFILSYEAKNKARRYFEFLYKSKDKHFGNARTAHNLFEEVVRFQSARLGVKDVDNLSDEELLTIDIDDVTASVQDEFDDKHVETIEEIMAELNTLVGLSEIKQNVLTLVNFIQTQKRLAATGHQADEITLHSVFFGPPGTGKTTVARILGRVYKALGLLPKGHLVEATRADLVAQFVGQTAPKTNEAIDNAMYGVLFIDEAYSLTSYHGSNDFGSEAVNTLLKRMDDERDKFAVIVAGYTREMQDFIGSNSGLESRFSNYFFFNDYSPDELLGIFKGKVEQKDFEITDGALEKVNRFFTGLYTEKSASFGNGRMVRNFYEKMVKAHANRLASFPNAGKEEMITFVEQDVEGAIRMFSTIFPGTGDKDARRKIGFKK